MVLKNPPNQNQIVDGRGQAHPIWKQWFDYVAREALAGSFQTGVNSVNGEDGTVVLDTDDIGEGASNLYYTNDRVDALLQAGVNITLTYDNVAGTLTIDSSIRATVTRVTTSQTINTNFYQWNGNTDGGDITLTLPAGSSGDNLNIVNTGTSNNTLTITPNGAEKLLGENSSFTLADGEALTLVYQTTDGWY